ncbi:MAG TPA: hypothetical protein VIL48_21635 [Acidimicrobiales bacterium]
MLSDIEIDVNIAAVGPAHGPDEGDIDAVAARAHDSGVPATSGHVPGDRLILPAS